MMNTFLDRLSPYLLLALAILFWAGNFNVARAVSSDVPPLGLSFWRWTLAFLLLLPFSFKAMKHTWPTVRQHIGIVILLSIVGIACFNSFAYLGLQSTTASNAVLLQSICPILIIILSTVLFGDNATRQQWLGVGLSLIGVTTILIRGDIHTLTSLDVQSGDLWVLIAVLSWATYTILLRKLPETLRGIPVLAYSMLFGILLIFPFYVMESINGRLMPITFPAFASVSYTAIFASLFAYLFWNNATSRLGANRTGQFIHLMPIFGLIIANLVLGESLQPFHYIGIVLVAAGLLLANLKNMTTAYKG